MAAVEKACEAFCVLSVGAMIIMNAVQVFFRYVFNMASVYVYPITMLLFIWITFIGAYVIYRRKKDIVVSFIIYLFPPAWRRYLHLLTNILTIILLVFILAECPMILDSQGELMEVIPLPRYTQALPMFFGLGCILLQYLLDTVRLIQNAPESNQA